MLQHPFLQVFLEKLRRASFLAGTAQWLLLKALIPYAHTLKTPEQIIIGMRTGSQFSFGMRTVQSEVIPQVRMQLGWTKNPSFEHKSTNITPSC